MRATLNDGQILPNPLPDTITFQLLRRSVNATYQLTANRVSTNPLRYQGLWTVTDEKGRWEIKVEYPHTSNTAIFKIDKRSQVVQVANSWVGARQYGHDLTPPVEDEDYHGGEVCDDICRYIYRQVGLNISQAGDPDGLGTASVASTALPGSMAFYRNAASGVWQHVGIEVGDNNIVDQNCGCPHSQPPLPTIGSHSDTHPNLQNTQDPQHPHYDLPPFYLDLPELLLLDAE